MTEVRYILTYHPGVRTDIEVEQRAFVDAPTQTTRLDTPSVWTWAEAREYCRESYKAHGVTAEISSPERFKEVFQWIRIP